MRSLDRKNKSISTNVNIQHIRNGQKCAFAQKRASTRFHCFISCTQGCDINVVVHRISNFLKSVFIPFYRNRSVELFYFYPDNAPTVMFSIISDTEISEMLIPRNIDFFLTCCLEEYDRLFCLVFIHPSIIQLNSNQVYLYSAFYDTIIAKQLYRKLSFYNIFIYCRNLIYLTYGKIW